MSENTKKRSLDKLFGTKEVRDTSSDAAGDGEAVPSSAPSKSAAKKGRGKTTKRSAPAKTRAKKTAVPDPAEDAGPGGYLGEGRYRRGDGVMEKPSIYVRPDQARALRMAAAVKDDPNGKTMSEIIQSLLDQHGYCDPQ
jgi:hypothetical protein